MYDVIIIGGGPAGLTAAVYALRAGKSVLVIEKQTFGGQITFSPKVENIPGFTEISGNEFAEKLVDQAMAQGAEFEMQEVLAVRKTENGFLVQTDGGDFSGKTVIIATGAKHRTLGLEGEQELIGNGISFCAVCDGAFFKDADVGVVGGGNSALQEALLLSETSKTVHVFQNLDFLTGEAKLIEQIENKDNVTVHYGCTVIGYDGEGMLTGIKVKQPGGEKDYPLSGVFLAVGLEPQNDKFSNVVSLDNRGYAEATDDVNTKTAGVFVAGDCRSKKIRQVATAASDGAIAALAACAYIDQNK